MTIFHLQLSKYFGVSVLFKMLIVFLQPPPRVVFRGHTKFNIQCVTPRNLHKCPHVFGSWVLLSRFRHVRHLKTLTSLDLTKNNDFICQTLSSSSWQFEIWVHHNWLAGRKVGTQIVANLAKKKLYFYFACIEFFYYEPTLIIF